LRALPVPQGSSLPRSVAPRGTECSLHAFAGHRELSRAREMDKSECHFIKCTDHTKFMERNIYTQEQLLHFNSDVGLFVGDTSFGKKVARYCNSNLKCMEHRQAAVDRHYLYPLPQCSSKSLPTLPVAPSISISLVPSSSQPGPGRLLCSLMDFSPAHIQLSCSQGQQQLSGHMLATAVLPSGDWSQQLLVLSSCQVEHGSLEHPLSRHWGTARPPQRRGQRGRHWGGPEGDWDVVGVTRRQQDVNVDQGLHLSGSGTSEEAQKCQKQLRSSASACIRR
uniref:Uncharacterized protein n=1 Tax=Cyanistes caeruleus TaxID=156563 RepID=A0A8C0ZEF8_CYACU